MTLFPATDRVWRTWPELGEIEASVVTVGVFDGFHRGHTALVDAAVAEGRRRRLPTLLVTFEPHPLVVLAPERAPMQLLTVAQRIEHALALGVDGVVVLPFDKYLAAQSADSFVEEGLVGRLGVCGIVVGTNFRCGRNGEGDLDFLSRCGRRLGFDVHGLDLVQHAGSHCSSTEVRRALARGDIDTAVHLLGRHDPEIVQHAYLRNNESSY